MFRAIKSFIRVFSSVPNHDISASCFLSGVSLGGSPCEAPSITAQGPRCLPAVQHERGPRNSTLRRQVALYLKEATSAAGLRMAHSAASSQVCGPPSGAPGPSPPGALGSPHGHPMPFALHPAFMGPDGACAAALYQSSLRPPALTSAAAATAVGLCHPTPKVTALILFALSFTPPLFRRHWP